MQAELKKSRITRKRKTYNHENHLLLILKLMQVLILLIY